MENRAKHRVRVAVTDKDGEIFQRYEDTENLRIFDTEGHKIVGQEMLDAKEINSSSFGSCLTKHNVGALICGEIAYGAAKSLHNAGVLVYAGNSGNAEQAVERLLNNELFYDPGAHLSEESGCDCCVGQRPTMEVAAEIGRISGHRAFGSGHNGELTGHNREDSGHNHHAGHGHFS